MPLNHSDISIYSSNHSPLQSRFDDACKECSDTFKNDHELKELFDLSVNMNNLKIKEREAKLKYKLNCKKFSFGKLWENDISARFRIWFEMTVSV